MANLIYLKLTGKNQGLISAGCSTRDSIGNKYQESHKDEILVYSFDHDIYRLQNVSHSPVTITKPVDKSSPLLSVSISDNEQVECDFTFYRTSESGNQEKFYTIKLTKASIKNVSIHFPNSLTHEDAQPYESITIDYESITWSHVTAGTSGYSIKNDNNI
uniref:Hcp family type VI secretion system effector n=1 Tax=Providencia stuartii TaxID=588 RepID=A0AAI9DD95_PROST|nr:Hcp family type VI secretion system effector [Providencia stuartii]